MQIEKITCYKEKRNSRLLTGQRPLIVLTLQAIGPKCGQNYRGKFKMYRYLRLVINDMNIFQPPLSYDSVTVLE